jgi:hypothetical protein
MKPRTILLYLYMAIAAFALLAFSVRYLEAEWMPMDHEGQDVTDETTALWILEQLEEGG